MAAASGTGPRLGVGMHSLGRGRVRDPLTFLEYALRIGAEGVQVAIGIRDASETARLRAKAEECGAYLEAQGTLPRAAAEIDRLERELMAARESGATVYRTAMLSGRRYETFATAEQFEEFHRGAWAALQLCEPVFRKHRMRLAVENHKDFLVPELISMLQRLGSEYAGVTLDTGNSIALAEDPYEIVESLAPLAFTVHLKDMSVQACGDGFFLSEVPMGAGFLDMKRIVETIHRAAPRAHFNIEMITRDPLRVPSLTDRYWATMGSRPARVLARTEAMVKAHPPKFPLPHVTGLTPEARQAFEDENVRSYVTYWTETLRL